MPTFTRGVIYGVCAVALIVVVAGCTITNSNTNNNANSANSAINVPPGTYDALAKCLSEKGAKFYGAFWCPHCQDQKDIFGSSVEFLPYIECSDPNEKNSSIFQQACKDANIKSYPTWVFADGSRLVGKQELSTLADKTGCQLPNINQNTNQ